jgi:hypothetical protein
MNLLRLNKRIWIGVFLSILCTAPIRGAGKDHIELKWSAQAEGSVSATTLEMRVPREYVGFISRDPKGEDARIRHVNNNGIASIDIQFLYPGLTAQTSAKDQTGDAVYAQLSASYLRRRGGLSIRDQLLHEAKKQMVYRLPDQHGLERFRRMTCAADSQFDPMKYNVPLNEPPAGCRELGEESLVGSDEGVRVWVTCGRGEGRCAMRTYFQGRWQLTLAFSRSLLPEWRNVRSAAEKLLSGFTAR